MAYNPRMSMAASNTQQNNRNRKKDNDRDIFYLADGEIADCISVLGVPFTAGDLQRPNILQVQQVFQTFAEVLLNTTYETVNPAMRAATVDVCGEFPDIIPSDVRNLMGFFVSLRRFLFECGITDFTFQDLQKPTYERLSRIFSYVINFVRFRQNYTGILDEYYKKAEETKMRIETLYEENREMEIHLDEMRRNRMKMGAHAVEKIKRNKELKHRLLELQTSQAKVAARFENLHQKKAELAGILQDKTATIITLRQESSKLLPYSLQSPVALQSSLTELNNTLNNDKTQIDALDRRARALQTSADSFTVAATDIGSCTKLLEEISVELSKEEEENSKNARQREALSERGNNVREIERAEGLLQRQLAKYNERTEKLREGSREKAQAAKERMEELRKVHRQLAEERAEKARDMERRRVRIEQTEKKMVDLKENIENEVHNAHDEFLKMDSHVKLYIKEMEQSI